MTEIQYDPPEAKIAEVISKTGGDPRKLAIAYLRAQKRFRDNELVHKMMGDLDESMILMANGDFRGATKALERSKRRIKTFNELAGDT